MTKTKLLALVAFLLIITPVLFFLRSPYSGSNFLRGATIPIIDRFQSSFVERTHLTGRLKRVSKERLNNGWQKFARIGSVVIWRTFATSVIVPGSQKPQLRQDQTSLRFEPNLIHDGVAAGRWSYDGNQVFVTLESGTTPDQISYELDTTTLLSSEVQRLSGEDAKAQIFQLHRADGQNGSWVVFFLKHPLFVQKSQPVSPDIVLKKEGRMIPAEEWKWQSDWNVDLYHASAVGELRMFSAGNKYDQEFYLKGGPISIRVVARGEMAGSEFPRLGIFLEDQKVGAIEVREKEDRPYEIDTFVKEGLHHIRIVFENDYSNPEKNEDRNVDVTRISLIYRSALMLKSATSFNVQSKYTIDYTTHDWQQDLYYQAFLSDRAKARQPIDLITGNIDMQKEERRSLLLGSGDRIQIPLIVPKDALLKFGCGFQHPSETPAHGQFLVRAHRAFHLPVILYSKNWDEDPVWRDTTVNLDALAGDKVLLSFESIPSNINDTPASLAFISNPLIESQARSNAASKYIFLISFDALRADHLGVYGYNRPTSPNIDAFARDSVVFQNALTTVTWTLPSFASLFTSLYPDFHNVVELNNFLPASFQTLPVLLKQNGFSTTGFVDSPLLYPVYGLSRGFDFYNYDITEVEERSRPLLNWIDSSSPGNQFVFVHLISPHSPYSAPDRYLHRLASDYTPDMPLSLQHQLERTGAPCGKVSEKELHDLILLYDAEVLQLDEIFQHIIEHLKKKNVYDEATIILMSDHGEEFQEHNNLFHGKSVYQETAHVPLIIKFPKGYPKLRGLRVPESVQLIDVMPTLLDAYQVDKAPWMQGRSLFRSLITNQSKRTEERTFFIHNNSGILGIVHGQYKYIYTNAPMVPYSCHPLKEEELYDLEKDPGETKDLSADRPDLISFFRSQRAVFNEQAAAYRKSVQRPGETQTIEVDTNAREQLRALGYIQ